MAATPFVDAATLAFAAQALETLELGLDSSLDYLGVGLSQADAIGHAYGPLSREQLDNLMPQMEQRLYTLLDMLNNGAPLPAWGDQETCSYCEFSGLCRRESWA